MKLKSFIKHIITEGYRKNKTGSIKIFEPALVSTKEGDKYSGGRQLHANAPNALAHNGKNMFYSFDLTNSCNRGCPGCYVDRAKEIKCNAVSDLPFKEYKGDLKKWEEWGNKSPENKKILEDTKKQINDNGGIRMFSAADYPNSSDPFYQEIMKKFKVSDPDYFKHNVKAFLDDAHSTGWHVKAITKELNFLKDHIDHPALKGVDVSMNAQGFGESHEVVKALRSGKHDHKSLNDADKEKLANTFSKEDAKKLAKHSDKIIGRTVTHTPFDLLKLIEHKNDNAHIGVITSGHDIPGNGIRYVPSKPKQPFSPKTIIIQSNFPEKLMHWLDGDVKFPDTKTVTDALNNYAKKYNELRDNASKALKSGTIEVLNIKDSSPEIDTVMNKTAGIDEASKDEGEYISDDAPSKKTSKEPEHREKTTLHKIDGVWKQVIYSEKTGKRVESKANLIPNIEEEFDKINPPFTHVFTDEDTKYLVSKMQGKMCCAGEDKGEAAGGKCHHCKAKCGVKGCGSNQEPTRNMKSSAQTDTMEDNVKKESIHNKFIDLL